jgi:hypothetical protein
MVSRRAPSLFSITCAASSPVRNVQLSSVMVSDTRLVPSSSLARELFAEFQDHLLWFGALLLLARLL